MTITIKGIEKIGLKIEKNLKDEATRHSISMNLELSEDDSNELRHMMTITKNWVVTIGSDTIQYPLPIEESGVD